MPGTAKKPHLFREVKRGNEDINAQRKARLRLLEVLKRRAAGKIPRATETNKERLERLRKEWTAKIGKRAQRETPTTPETNRERLERLRKEWDARIKGKALEPIVMKEPDRVSPKKPEEPKPPQEFTVKINGTNYRLKLIGNQHISGKDYDVYAALGFEAYYEPIKGRFDYYRLPESEPKYQTTRGTIEEIAERLERILKQKTAKKQPIIPDLEKATKIEEIRIKRTVAEFNKKAKEKMSDADINVLAHYVAIVERHAGGIVDIEKLLSRGVAQKLPQKIRDAEPLFQRKYQFRTGNVMYTICPTATVPDNPRKFCVIYVTKGTETKITTYYQSNSSTEWRLLPMLKEGGGYYKSILGEEALALPWKVQKVLDGMTPQTTQKATAKTFTEIAPHIDEIQEKEGEQEGTLEKYVAIDKTVLLPTAQKVVDTGAPTNLPDFRKILGVWPAKSSLYGDLHKVAVESGNGEFVWMFAVTSRGVFPTGVQLKDGTLSKYGITEVPRIRDDLSSLLTTPIMEYLGQLLNKLINQKRWALSQNNTVAVNKIDAVLNTYKKYKNRERVGEYVDVFSVLMQHPLIAGFQIEVRRALEKHKEK